MKNNRLLYLFIIILTIWCIFLSIKINNTNKTNGSVVNEYNVTGFSTDLTKVAEDKKTSLVTIECGDNISTGFVYGQNGEDVYILTSYHGIANHSDCKVKFASGFTLNAEEIGEDLYLDLAVLKILSPYNVDVLNLTNSSLVKTGEIVLCSGSPSSFDYNNSFELGMISNNHRAIYNSINVNSNVINYYLDVLQVSANLTTGYSGSPVLNMNGDVIGMITMSLEKGFNFAITSNEIKIVADSIINGSPVNKVHLGINGSFLKDMPSFERSNYNIAVDIVDGIFVRDVLDLSVANSAGLRDNDIILSINGVSMSSFDNYLNVVYNVSNSLEFDVLRDGEDISLKVDSND